MPDPLPRPDDPDHGIDEPETEDAAEDESAEVLAGLDLEDE